MSYSSVDVSPEIQSIVSAEIEDAVNFIDHEIAPLRVKATKYYRGDPFGDEQEGRSRVVSRDVADTVQAILPSLLRVFVGSERVVEYVPKRADSVDQAEQATDYANYIIFEDNPGFMVFYETFKDALISKTGVVKFWNEETQDVTKEDCTGLSDDVLAMVSQEKDIAVKVRGSYPDVSNPQGTLHDVTLTKTSKDNRIKIASVPPEEFLISRNARSIDTADLVGHRTDLTHAELVAMGYSEDELEEFGYDSDLETNMERLARATTGILGLDNSHNPANKRIRYTEAFLKLDMGDGAELRQVCCMGNQYKIMRNDPVDERPFSLVCPVPEPHVVFGSSTSDLVMDIQRIKSQVYRGILDSLAQSINPRTWVVEGQVNTADVLSNEVGGMIRMRQPLMAGEFTTPFVGQAALPILDLMDSLRESRTGITKASQGLDADAMQSTTKAAVAATITAAQQQIEMICRIFAETGIKSLFKGILRLICKHQDKTRMVRLRGKWVPIDPRAWDATMDVSVNVGLGAGTNAEKVDILAAIAQKQELILSTLGATNPVVSPAQYSNTLRKAAELSGFKDSSLFFSAVPSNYQPPAPQQHTDPAQQSALILAQAQREQLQSEEKRKSAELTLKERDMQMNDALKRYQIESNERVALATIAAQYGAKVESTQAQIDQANQNLLHQQAQSELDRQHEAEQNTQAQQAAMQQQQSAQQATAQQQPAGGQT